MLTLDADPLTTLAKLVEQKNQEMSTMAPIKTSDTNTRNSKSHTSGDARKPKKPRLGFVRKTPNRLSSYRSLRTKNNKENKISIDLLTKIKEEKNSKVQNGEKKYFTPKDTWGVQSTTPAPYSGAAPSPTHKTIRLFGKLKEVGKVKPATDPELENKVCNLEIKIFWNS